MNFPPSNLPNSWFRSFRRTGVQKLWDSAAELDDTVFAQKFSSGPDRSALRVYSQRDKYGLGCWLRLDYKPPRECQCGSYMAWRHVLSGACFLIFIFYNFLERGLMCELQCPKNMQHAYINTCMTAYMNIYIRTYCMNTLIKYLHAYACSHTQHVHVHIPLSRPQKTSRLDRKFSFRMAARSGSIVKISRASMLTTRAQCGGRTCTRCHVAKALTRQSERMADTASPYAKPHHQAPF